MAIDFSSKSGHFTHDGVTILCFSFRYPAADGAAGELYRKAAEAEQTAMEGRLFPVLAARYEEDRDRRKRFRFLPFRLLSEATVTFENEDLVSIRSELCLSKGRETLCRTIRGAVWRKSDGMLLSPRHCLAVSRKVRRAAKEAAFYLEDGFAVFEREGERTRFSLKKKLPR